MNKIESHDYLIQFPEEIWVMILEWIDLESYPNLSQTCSMINRLIQDAFVKKYITQWRVEFLIPLFPELKLDEEFDMIHAKNLLTWISLSHLFCKKQSQVSVCFGLSMSKGCDKCESTAIIRGDQHATAIPWTQFAKETPKIKRYVIATCFQKSYSHFLQNNLTPEQLRGRKIFTDFHMNSGEDKHCVTVYEANLKENSLCRDYKSFIRLIFCHFVWKRNYQFDTDLLSGNMSCSQFEQKILLQISPIGPSKQEPSSLVQKKRKSLHRWPFKKK